MAWQIRGDLHFDLKVKDLAGQIRWDQAPYTTARVTSDTVNFDENGFIETTPALSGVEGYKDYTQTMPLQSVTRLHYQFSKQYGVFGANDQYGHEHFPSIGLTKRSTTSLISVAWQANSEALQFTHESESWRMKLTTDHVELKKMKTFGLELALKFSL